MVDVVVLMAGSVYGKYIMQGEEQASIIEICKSASLQICEISMNGIDQGQLTEQLEFLFTRISITNYSSLRH